MPDLRQLFLASSQAKHHAAEEVPAAPATMHAASQYMEHLTRSLSCASELFQLESKQSIILW